MSIPVIHEHRADLLAELGRAAANGCAFSLAFGWLWFSELRQLWVPGYFSGAEGLGSLRIFAAFFCCALVPWGWIGQRIITTHMAISRPKLLAHCLHTSGLLCLGVAFLMPNVPGAPSCLLAVAAAAGGVYWTRQLLSLPPLHVLIALGFASIMASLLVFFASALPAVQYAPLLHIGLAVCLFAAWICAVAPAVRGVPRKNDALPDDAPSSTQSYFENQLYFVSCLILFCLGLAFSTLQTHYVENSWLHCVLQLSGLVGAGVLWIGAKKWYAELRQHIGAVLLLCAGIVGILDISCTFATPSVLFFTVSTNLLLGMLAVAWTATQTGCEYHNIHNISCLRSALVLLCIFLGINGGFWLGQRIADMTSSGFILALTMVPPLVGIVFMGIRMLSPASVEPDTWQRAAQGGNSAAQSVPMPTIKPEYKALLNVKEQAIAVLMAQGNSNVDIADCTALSKNTIRWYIKRIYKKIDVNDRQELVEKLF